MDISGRYSCDKKYQIPLKTQNINPTFSNRNLNSKSTTNQLNPSNLYKLHNKSGLGPIFLPLPPDATSNDYWELNDSGGEVKIKGIANNIVKSTVIISSRNTKGLFRKGKQNLENVIHGMNNSSKDSNSNSNSVNTVKSSYNDIFLQRNHGEKNFEDSSGNDNNDDDSDSIANENHFESHTFGPSFNIKRPITEGGHHTIIESFDYKEETDHKQNSRKIGVNKREPSSRNLSSRSGEQLFAKLQSTYVKTAGVNSSISATANNHRKNLKLRQQNMDHDYR